MSCLLMFLDVSTWITTCIWPFFVSRGEVPDRLQVHHGRRHMVPGVGGATGTRRPQPQGLNPLVGQEEPVGCYVVPILMKMLIVLV